MNRRIVTAPSSTGPSCATPTHIIRTVNISVKNGTIVRNFIKSWIFISSKTWGNYYYLQPWASHFSVWAILPLHRLYSCRGVPLHSCERRMGNKKQSQYVRFFSFFFLPLLCGERKGAYTQSEISQCERWSAPWLARFRHALTSMRESRCDVTKSNEFLNFAVYFDFLHLYSSKVGNTCNEADFLFL